MRLLIQLEIKSTFRRIINQLKIVLIKTQQTTKIDFGGNKNALFFN
jgi:hypothetical protein